MPAKNVREEDNEQMAFFQWAAASTGKYPDLVCAFAVFNGGKMSGTPLQRMIAGRRNKAMGLKPGVYDIFFPHARGGYHGLFIEMKRRKGGVVSKEQKAFAALMHDQRYMCVVCEGSEPAITAVKRYMILTRS